MTRTAWWNQTFFYSFPAVHTSITSRNNISETFVIISKWQTQEIFFILISHNKQYNISREKLEPEPGFEPQTSGFLARRSAT